MSNLFNIGRTIFGLAIIVSCGLMIVACSSSDDTDSTDTAGKETYDFRKTTWGMSQKDVWRTETKVPDEETPELLRFSGEYHGMIAMIGYIFEDDKLTRGAYLIREEYEDPSYHIKDFETITNHLIKEYGEPLGVEETWVNEDNKDDSKSRPESICAGDLAYVAEWMTDNSMIRLTLTGNDNMCFTGVFYNSNDLYVKPKMDKMAEENEAQGQTQEPEGLTIQLEEPEE